VNEIAFLAPLAMKAAGMVGRHLAGKAVGKMFKKSKTAGEDSTVPNEQ